MNYWAVRKSQNCLKHFLRGKNEMANHTNVNIGNSGEYFVAGELERRGFTVALPMSNVKDFDILAINRESYEQFAIQVKTTGYKQKKWTLSAKNETLVGDNIVYIFVSLNELDMPEYHIVPSKIVAKPLPRNIRNGYIHRGKMDNSIMIQILEIFTIRKTDS